MVLGNPAQRLHQILAAFDSASGSAVPVKVCWQRALECSEEQQLAACFGSALSLISEIRTRIDSQNLTSQRSVVDRYEAAWLKPFMPDRGWQSHSQALVDADSLLALTSLSEIFATLEPIPVIVGAHHSETLLGLLDDARAAVRDEADLPPDLRTVILDRLYDVEWAIQHHNLHGSAGLQAALDRLGAELARTPKRGAWRRKVGLAFVCGWLVFSHADDVVNNLDATATIVNEVRSWAQEARGLMEPDRLELPSGATEGDAQSEDTDVVDAEVVEDDER